MKKVLFAFFVALLLTVSLSLTACGGGTEECKHANKNTVKENETAASCTALGSYDEVVYCKDCKIELEREKKTVPLLAHNYNDGICKMCGAEQAASAGLEFEEIDDDTCSLIGIGSCTDTDILIPECDPDGRTVVAIDIWGQDGFTDIESIVIPKTVTEISSFAFSGCSKLESIKVDEGNATYKSIDGNLYTKDGKTFLTYAPGKRNAEFVIPDSVEKVDAYAFCECNNLVSVTIGENVTNIDYYSFIGCCRLVEVVNKSSIKIEPVFYGELTSNAIIIHSGDGLIKNVNDYLFITADGVNYLVGYTNDALELVLPENYNGESYTVNAYALYGLQGITRVTIGEGVNNIGNFAFSLCSSLIGIDVSENNTSYKSIDGNLYTKDGKKLLSYASGKEDASFTLPDGVTEICSGAFGYCSNVAKVVLCPGVVRIGESAFVGCSALREIVMPDSLEEIGSSAFMGCTSLESVNIPDNVERINAQTFHECSSLTTLKVGSGLKIIDVYAFMNCDKLTDVYIKDLSAWFGIETENSYFGSSPYLIANAENLYLDGDLVTDIVIPDGVTGTKPYLFFACFKSIAIPASVTDIDVNAFIICKDLASITVDANNKAYKSEGGILYTKNGEMLVYCSSKDVKSVNIPAGVKSIGNYAFFGNTELESVKIPESVTDVGSYAFNGCTSLENIVFPDSVKKIGNGALRGCTSLASLTLPFVGSKDGSISFAPVNSISFIGLFDLETISIVGYGTPSVLGEAKVPDSLEEIVIKGGKKIGARVFANCAGLKRVVIPKTVTNIDYSAFWGCTNLTDVYYTGTEEEWNAILIGADNSSLENAAKHYEHKSN